MASSACLNCLSRPGVMQLSSSLSLQTPRTTVAAFSSTRQLKASKPPPAGRKMKTLKLKKRAAPKVSGKPPNPGDRKAMRKRVVLSNTNALPVKGMVDMSPEMVTDAGLVGKVVGLSSNTVDKLRASEAFKAKQSWGLFRRPGILIRKESVILGEKLLASEEKKQVLRLVIDGGRVTGKSLMLINALAIASLRGWIILNIPEAQDLTMAGTDYAPIPDTDPVQYSQNTYTANWLTRIAKANKDIFDGLEVSLEHTLPFPLQSNITLSRLCELGARDPEAAWPVFAALWAELTVPGRPPLMITMDGLQHAMLNSMYRAQDYSIIHSHDLAIIGHFTKCISGTENLPNGGAVIAATSRSHTPVNPSVDIITKQLWEKHTKQEITPRDPWEKNYDPKAEEALKSVEVLKLHGLSREEARGLMEYWALSGLLRARVDEKTVTEKWTLAGGGIVGEIERGALRARI